MLPPQLSEAKSMLMRVIPVYDSDSEYDEFMAYVKERGFSTMPMAGVTLKRFNQTKVFSYENYGQPGSAESIAEELNNNTNLVINFANPSKEGFEKITEYLQYGKMLVDWLDDWRNNRI